MENSNKKNKVSGIIAIITSSIASLTFIAALFFAINFFITIDAYKKPEDNGSGWGLFIYLLVYIITVLICAPFSVSSIILGKIAKKWNKKIGNICLFTNIGYLTTLLVIFILMKILV